MQAWDLKEDKHVFEIYVSAIGTPEQEVYVRASPKSLAHRSIRQDGSRMPPSTRAPRSTSAPWNSGKGSGGMSWSSQAEWKGQNKEKQWQQPPPDAWAEWIAHRDQDAWHTTEKWNTWPK